DGQAVAGTGTGARGPTAWASQLRPSEATAQGQAFASHRLASSDRLARSHLPTPGGREEPLVPGERFELPTNGLQNRCSTTELTRQINELRRNSSRFVLTASPRAPAIAEEAVGAQKNFKVRGTSDGVGRSTDGTGSMTL